MADEKVKLEIELHPAQAEYLDRMINEYGLPDRGKALRCLLDYAEEEGDPDDIFETVRCLHCR